MKDAILNLVKNRQHVSMVELCREIPGFKGNLDWVLGTNTVIWINVSEKAIEAMNSLVRENKIEAVSCSPWVYITDGAMLEYPLVTSLTADFKKPHWLPVTFSTPDQAKRDGAKQ